MDLSRRRILAATGASLVIAGCLGDDETDDTTPPADDDDSNGDNMADENGEPADATVHVRSHPEFGDILVGPDEMTLYNFDADTQGEAESACDNDCADAWPALTVEDAPVAGADVIAELTTFERDNGTMQVAADGWPLYYFAGDEDPGDTEGQGVNDVWWVLGADGTPIREADDPEEEKEEVDADATVTVGADGLHFDPETLEIDVGDAVAFVWEGDGHNIAVTEQPAEASWEGVDEIQDAGFTHHHTFDVSGDYEYVCEPHEGAGMAGSIHVGEGDENDDGGGYGY